jgi:hypothetical protein
MLCSMKVSNGISLKSDTMDHANLKSENDANEVAGGPIFMQQIGKKQSSLSWSLHLF